ncbi:hypothetical protein [Paenibacillus sp. 1P07SE]
MAEEEWSRILCEDVFQANHRHVIFTIDAGLWDVFLLVTIRVLAYERTQ